jgi:hypothetical protein
MDASVEVLERYGLVADEDSFRVLEFDRKKAFKLHRELFESIFDRQPNSFVEDTTHDPFSFLASASLRGQSGCSSPICRLQKFDFLARYTALYANRVLLPVPLSHPSTVRTVAEVRHQLADSALMLLRLRPVVDSELIVPVVMRTKHCAHTIRWVNKMTSLVHEFADDVAKELQKEFRVLFEPANKSSNGVDTVYIQGPEDFVEHGELIISASNAQIPRPRSTSADRHGNLEIRGRMKAAIVRWILNNAANDTTFYLAHRIAQKARYLTDRRGETFFLDGLTEDKELQASSAAMNAYLTHALPLLGDLPVASLLRIRRDERDSFLRYRSALEQILIKISERHKRVGEREIRDLFKEVIEPQLVRMKSELHQESRRQRRRIIGGLGTLAASVALGTFGGMVPLLIKASIVGAGSMVGGRLLSKAAETTCEHGAILKEKNDFYFLLRLTQEAEVN